MGVKERLREYIKTLNISEREFCRQIGVSVSYVNSIRTSIQPDKMKSIGEKFLQGSRVKCFPLSGNPIYLRRNPKAR